MKQTETIRGWVPVLKPLAQTGHSIGILDRTRERLQAQGVEVRVRTDARGRWVLERLDCPQRMA